LTWFLVIYQGSLVGLCVQDYKSLCAAGYDLCHPIVIPDRQTDTERERETDNKNLISLYE